MQKLINKYSYAKLKKIMIALIVGSSIIFMISLGLAIVTSINFNSYTTITM